MLEIEVRIQPIRDTSQIEYLKGAADVAENALLVFFSSNMLVSIFLAGILQFLWSVINTLQIMMLVQLFLIQIPENASVILTVIQRLSSLDFIDTSSVFMAIFDFRETKDFRTVTSNNG